MRNDRGFTLLEVLIALAVLAISMMGIYNLIGQALSVETYADAKLKLVQKGYERVVKTLTYGEMVLQDVETDDNLTVRFTNTSTPTAIPGVSEHVLTGTSDDAEITYIYYKRQ